MLPGKSSSRPDRACLPMAMRSELYILAMSGNFCNNAVLKYKHYALTHINGYQTKWSAIDVKTLEPKITDLSRTDGFPRFPRDKRRSITFHGNRGLPRKQFGFAFMNCNLRNPLRRIIEWDPILSCSKAKRMPTYQPTAEGSAQ